MSETDVSNGEYVDSMVRSGRQLYGGRKLRLETEVKDMEVINFLAIQKRFNCGLKCSDHAL